MASATSFIPNGLLSLSSATNILTDENEAPIAGPSSLRVPALTAFATSTVEASLPATESSAEGELVSGIDALKDMESFLDVIGAGVLSLQTISPQLSNPVQTQVHHQH